MCVVDEHVCCASGDGTLDRRVDLADEQVASERVILAVGDALRPVDDARDTFHIHGDVDPHARQRVTSKTTRPARDAPAGWVAGNCRTRLADWVDSDVAEVQTQL